MSDTPDRQRDRRILTFLSETVWACLPSTLWTIREIVRQHAAGVKLSAEEIEQRVSGGRAKPDSSSGAIAVVPLWGVLVPHAGMMVDISTPGTGLDQWLAEFQEFVDDPNVGTILLQVNSPGGSASRVTETAAAVRAARAKKHVVAVADTLAASAAFCIASQADTFIASPSAFVGAVHTYLIHEDISQALESEGVKVELIGEPDNGAAEMPPFEPLSDDNRAHLQATARQFYEKFVADVAKGRGVSTSTVENNFGRGHVLTATDALAAGMVDGVASFDEVLARLAAGQPAVPGGAKQLTTVESSEYDPGATALEAVAVAAAAEFAGAFVEQHARPRVSQIVPAQSAQPPAARTVSTVKSGRENPTQGGSAMEATSLDRPLTLEELAAEKEAAEARKVELNEQAPGRVFTPEEQAEFDSCDARVEEIEQTVKNIQDREARIAKQVKQTERHVAGVGLQTGARGRHALPENLFDLAAYRGHANTVEDLAAKWQDGARFVNEKLDYASGDPEKVRTFVERLLDKDPSAHPSESFAHRILLTSSPEYDRAFGKHVMGRGMTSHEERLVKMAVSETGLGSELPVPVTIDPTVLLTSDGATNPLREISRVITITGNKWRGISSDGVSVAYEAELSQVADQTPTFAAPEAEVEKAQGWVEFSIEVDQDWGSFRSELQMMFADAKNTKEADKFLNGTGTNEPEGLLWKLDDDGSTVIDTASVNTLTLADIEDLPMELPPRWDANARWLASKGFYSQANKLARAENGQDVWVPIAQGFTPGVGGGGLQYSLRGYPTSAASEMSSAFTTGGEYVAVLGDFQRGFVIIDRVGLNVELVPIVMGANQRPKGSRGLYVYFRNTSQVRTVKAFRALRILHS